VTSWTVDTLRAHLVALIGELDRRSEQRFDAQEKAVQAALTAAKEAVLKAEVAAEKRADAANEFRGQLADQAATLMPRSETTLMFAAIAERVDKLEASADKLGGRRRGIADGWGYLVGAVGVVGALVALVLSL
jgi:hypothetical protein